MNEVNPSDDHSEKIISEREERVKAASRWQAESIPNTRGLTGPFSTSAVSAPARSTCNKDTDLLS